jgi:hypothetical protein
LSRFLGVVFSLRLSRFLGAWIAPIVKLLDVMNRLSPVPKVGPEYMFSGRAADFPTWRDRAITLFDFLRIFVVFGLAFVDSPVSVDEVSPEFVDDNEGDKRAARLSASARRGSGDEVSPESAVELKEDESTPQTSEELRATAWLVLCSTLPERLVSYIRPCRRDPKRAWDKIEKKFAAQGQAALDVLEDKLQRLRMRRGRFPDYANSLFYLLDRIADYRVHLKFLFSPTNVFAISCSRVSTSETPFGPSPLPMRGRCRSMVRLPTWKIGMLS